jgi:chromosome segregation ATPase
MTRSPDQRLDRIEDEFETVKQLLASAARYAESANEKIDQLSDRQDRTQAQLDQLSNRQDRTQVQIDQLSNRQDRTQAQLDQLSSKVDDLTTIQSQTESRLDEFIFQVQRLLTQNAERLIRVEGQADRLEALLLRLDRNYEAQQSQFLEFQRTTNAALERIDRVVDYLLRQQGNDNRD